MVKLIVRRLIQAIPILIAVSIFSFFLMHLAPGDPSQAYISPEMDLINLEQVREDMGLNEPIWVQYWRWLKNLLQGNLGYSLINRRPVLQQILDRLSATVGLMGTSLIISVIVGIILGIISAINYQKFVDQVISFVCYVLISIPGFWFAMMLIFLFALHLNWLPSVGMRTVGVNSFIDLLQHSIMPVTVLSIGRIATITRYVRNSMVREMNQDYIVVAEAMGASRFEIYFKYTLKNSLLPIITILGMSLPSLVSGAFIVESIFGWPGLGQLGMNAIFSYDYPLIMATTMFSALMLVVGNLLADILYGVVDPRVREAA